MGNPLSKYDSLKKDAIRKIASGDVDKMRNLEGRNIKLNCFLPTEGCGTNCKSHHSEKIYCYHFLAAFVKRSTFLALSQSKTDEYSSLVDLRTLISRKTPLMYAILHQNMETMKELLRLGSEVNASDRDGNTALHLAAKLGYVKIVGELLKQDGIHVSPKNEIDKTPLDEARYNNKHDVVKILRTKGVAQATCRRYIADDSGVSMPTTASMETFPFSDPEPHNSTEIPENEMECQSDEGATGVSDVDQVKLEISGYKKDGFLCTKYEKQLQRSTEMIILKLKLEEVINKMVSEELISHRTYQLIMNERNCSFQIRQLIDQLYRTSNRNFERFLDILRETDQEILANEIEKTLVDNPSSDTNPEEPARLRRTANSRSCVELAISGGSMEQYRISSVF